MKKILFYNLLGVVLTATVACHSKTETEETEAFTLSDTMMHRIRLDNATLAPVRSELTLVGKVSADENKVIKVFPMVGGVVEDVDVELGDFVKKGQKLAVIRSGEVADYEKQMIEAQSDLLLAQKNLRVAEDLYQSKLNSQREVVAAQKEVEKSQAELNRVKEVFRIYGLGKSSMYTVRSPIDGFVMEKNINRETQLRSDNAGNLFTIGQISDVWVLANVNESDIGRVKLGMLASIQTLSYPDQTFNGQVDKIFSVLDPATKAMTVRIRLRNEGLKLKPEMHATVTLRFEEGQQMTAVPAQSVIFDRSKHYVMVFRDRSNIDTREVDVYKSLGDVAYIRAGLKPGEQVISRNQLLVYDALND